MIWNFRENHWTVGYVSRLSGVDAGVANYPIRLDADGNIWEHEVGSLYPGAAMPWLESGPIEAGAGDNVVTVNMLYPDDKIVGDVTATFLTSYYPDEAEVLAGPYVLTKKTDLRFTCRQFRVRFDAVSNDNWRIGVPRIDVIVGGRR